MTPAERRAGVSLATIFAARMLGLFLVLPVFALEAARYPGGTDPALVGLAMGIYGLTQGLLQIPFGLASDRLGRKRVIAFGLLVFAAGSFVAAAADSLTWLIVGRSLQGAGAVSAAVTALLADQTRDEVRTKAMAMVGASIGLVFALSLVAGPLLVAQIGLGGLFAVTGGLALACIAVLAWWTPAEVTPTLFTSCNALPPEGAQPPRGGPSAAEVTPTLFTSCNALPPEGAQPPRGGPSAAELARGRNLPRGRLREVLRHPGLLRLNLGVFVLHAVQLAMWVAVPALLVQAGLAQERHWQVYLPAVLASFAVMGMTLFPLERRGYLRAVFLGSVAAVTLVQVGLLLVAGQPGIGALAALLFVFFCGFNVLEASQPSMASRIAPQGARGAALGVYNTLQSLGFFAGGAVGGWLAKNVGTQGLFLACAALMGIWLAVAWPMRVPASGRSAREVLADEAQAT